MKTTPAVGALKSDDELFSDIENNGQQRAPIDDGGETSKKHDPTLRENKGTIDLAVGSASSIDSECSVVLQRVDPKSKKPCVTYGRSKVGNKYIPKRNVSAGKSLLAYN